jgi:hypothetical protein
MQKPEGKESIRKFMIGIYVKPDQEEYIYGRQI